MRQTTLTHKAVGAGLLALVLLAQASMAFIPGRMAVRTLFQPLKQHQASRVVLSMAEAIEIAMPALSSTMTEGKIVEWTAKVGDKIKAGQTIMVVESDKADMDVEAFESGYVAAILAKAGEATPVGAPCALLVDNEADIEKVKAALAGGASVGAAA